jgi:flagellar hook-length control protein FliK
MRMAETSAGAETIAAAAPEQATDAYSRVSPDRSESGFVKALSEARAADIADVADAEPEHDAEPEETGGGDIAEQTEQIDMSVLAALFAAQPDTAPAPELAAETADFAALSDVTAQPRPEIADAAATADTAPRLVTILEGTAIDGTEKDDGKDNNGYSVHARADDTDGIASEDLARMPQARMQTGTQRQIPEERELEPVNIRDGAPCPLENVNEETGSVPAPTRSAEGQKAKSGGDEQRDDERQSQSWALPAETPVDVAPEKVAAAEQMKTVSAERLPATRENLFDTMVEKLEVMREDGVSTMSVELKPEYLGRVTLNLSMTDGGVSVRISASDRDVKGMIDGQIAALVENLSGKGVKIERVDVVYAGVSGGEYDSFGANSKSNGGGRGGARRNRSGVTPGAPAQLAAYSTELLWASVGDEDANTFEYSA